MSTTDYTFEELVTYIQNKLNSVEEYITKFEESRRTGDSVSWDAPFKLFNISTPFQGSYDIEVYYDSTFKVKAIIGELPGVFSDDVLNVSYTHIPNLYELREENGSGFNDLYDLQNMNDPSQINAIVSNVLKKRSIKNLLTGFRDWKGFDKVGSEKRSISDLEKEIVELVVMK